MLHAGEIGEPLTLRIKSLTGNMRHGWDVPANAQDWRSDEARSGQGSTVFDHGQHIWSIARYLMGDVERAFAFIGREQAQAHHELRPGAFLDNPTMATWKYRGADRYGSWESVYAEDMVIRSRYYPIYVSMELTGTRGVLWVNNFIGQRLDRTPMEMYRDGKITRFEDVDPDYATSFSLAVRDFIDAALEGRETDMTGPEAREVLRFSLAVLRSGKEGREVRIDEITGVARRSVRPVPLPSASGTHAVTVSDLMGPHAPISLSSAGASPAHIEGRATLKSTLVSPPTQRLSRARGGSSAERVREPVHR